MAEEEPVDTVAEKRHKHAQKQREYRAKRKAAGIPQYDVTTEEGRERLKRRREYNRDHMRRHHEKIDVRFIMYQQRAEDKNFYWRLNFVEFSYLVTSPCFYCGVLPVKGKIHGIDRYDNDKTYDWANSRTCCKQCNYAKKDFSADSFFEQNRLMHVKHNHKNRLSGYWSA